MTGAPGRGRMAFLEVVERAGTGLAYPTQSIELVGERKR